MVSRRIITDINTSCAHCGDSCIGDYPVQSDQHFCCQGCLMVWNLLHENQLSDYYAIDNIPGISGLNKKNKDYSFLDELSIKEKLISFSAADRETIILNLPQIHCSACVWLLENIHRLNKGIIKSRVDFLKKQAIIVYNNQEASLKDIVILLDKIGYAPVLQLNDVAEKNSYFQDNKLLYKIGLSGFCFGNIMLLSFPEYLGYTGESFMGYLGYINIVLALPVLIFSGRDYIISAWQSIKMGDLGIDVPIALGMLTLFFRSIYEIVSATGVGYLDSFSGFIFFLLIGRWFQNYTYSSISFDRDYRSFFPISVKYNDNGNWVDRSIDQLKTDDVIQIKSQEIIPCDGLLMNGAAWVDYSFVTGESDPVAVPIHGEVSAGGKQLSGPIDIKVKQAVNQSKLVQLWNNDIFSQKDKSKSLDILNIIGRYFSIVILIISFFTLMYWYFIDKVIAFNSFSAVLIIACPCVLALSVPFLYGNAIRLLTHKKIFAKNTDALYRLSQIDEIIFDKTGTLTDPEQLNPIYHGQPLSGQQLSWIKRICGYSNHPLSAAIYNFIQEDESSSPAEIREAIGQGLEAVIEGHDIKIGSRAFVETSISDNNFQSVYIKIDNEVVGYYSFSNQVRSNLDQIINHLSEHYKLTILSGDSGIRENALADIFPDNSQFYFDQSPLDKLEFIKKKQSGGQKILMIGDGLNDAGALKQSDIGMVLSSSSNNFTPSSDIILGAESFRQLHTLMAYARKLKGLLVGAFVLALIYNGIGLAFAVSGHLSPVVAAILMPASSITIVLYGVISSTILYRRVLDR